MLDPRRVRARHATDADLGRRRTDIERIGRDDVTDSDWRLAVDIGGTFTDVVLLDASSGDVVVDKTLTTPANPLDGVRTGVGQLLARAGVRPGRRHRADRPRDDADHQRTHRGQDRPGRAGDHRRDSATPC